MAGVSAEAGEPAVTVERLFGHSGPVGTRRTWLLVGALMLAACAGTGGLGVVQWAFFRPQSTVDGYFSALADPQRRRARLPDRPERCHRPQAARPTAARRGLPTTDDVEISSLERDSDAATAIVAYRLGGAAQTSTVSLRRDDEATAGLFHGWRVDGGLAALNAPSAGPGVRLNGVDLPGAAEGPALMLLPGGYTATGPSSALSETPAGAVWSPRGIARRQCNWLRCPSRRRSRPSKPGARLVGRVRQADGRRPPGCPFRYYGSSVQKVTWKILEYPKSPSN